MPQSDHLQSANIKITHKLAVAKFQARKIALFAGIDPSIFTAPLPSPNVTPTYNDDANKGISTSALANYEVVYACVPGETPMSDIMHEGAITIREKQQVDSTFDHIDIDDELEQLASRTQI
ncbi:hypothetical protein PGTUg99_016907 [Puccinia graminis f. sp. tritici]|uniref:Uncharacterized protein n=1 Tax=Puccinia graminis f. sp. tritici TaxID=56615 RepID=A0A5B0S8U5_PUCGR|nr:hypothetical protein PGTUg99_016907 [Puccinia graminis f. sp. tritici]